MTQISGHAMAQAFSHWYLTAEACVQSQARPCQIYDAQIGNRIGFSPSNLFSVVTVIPFTLLTHLFAYH
jgi:hypothetical protein